METTEGYTLAPTDHALRTILAKGFTGDQVLTAFASPEKITEVRKYPGQFRVCGNGVALVGSPDERTMMFTLVTVYADGVLTPPRPDQLDTPEGRRYAERYQAGLGRG